MTRGGEPARGCSVLIGRDDVLALAVRRWESAAKGTGHLLMLSGEAGIGKTRMLDEIVDRTGAARRLAASAFPGEELVPGGVLLNLAHELIRTGDRVSGAVVRDRIGTDAPRSLDAARRRRLLVGDLARALEPAIADRPTLLLVEDAHWADEVSLEVIARMIPAIRRAPCLVVVTLRDDEASRRPPVGPWRTRLLAQRLAEEVKLGRLDREGVALMAAAMEGASRPAADIDRLLERSDGIPLHVEELLSSRSGVVPETIADSVRLRADGLPEDEYALLQAASVIGRSFAPELLGAIAQVDDARIDSALRRLSEESFVIIEPTGESVVFRHALLCDAVYATISPAHRRELHAAVASEFIRRGLPEAMISDHLEKARRLDGAYRHALAGAREAASRSAHREAAALYRRAVRTAPTTIVPLERAQVAAALAAELLAVDDPRAAAESLAEAIQIYRSLRREIDAAALVPDLMLARHLLGASLEERSDLACTALLRLDAADVPVVEGTTVRATLLAALAAAHMLDRRLEDAMEFGRRAETLVGRLVREASTEMPFSSPREPDERATSPLAVALDVTLGSVLAFAGRGEAGWKRLQSAIRIAESAGWEQEAARAHRMIGSSASVLLEYPRAARCLARGIEYTAAVERWNDHHYLVAHSAHVLWATGGWDAAESRARAAMATGHGITTRITALQVLGYVALGRGNWSAARETLEESREHAERMGELQRISPTLWGLAELALAQGDSSAAVALCERALSASLAVADAAYLFPFIVTGMRAHLQAGGATSARSWLDRCATPVRHRSLPGTSTALEHAEGLLAAALGDAPAALAPLEAAEAGWTSKERWWEGAWALVDLADAARAAAAATTASARASAQSRRAASLALARANAIGAVPLARAASAVLTSIDSTAPLSPRELDVARLIAAGATNRAIAEHLVIAPKTVSAHVEHILVKLSASRRSEIAAWVVRAETPAT